MFKYALIAAFALAILGFVISDVSAWGGGGGGWGGKGWNPPGGDRPAGGGSGGGGATPPSNPGGNRPDPGANTGPGKEEPAKTDLLNDEFKFELIDDKAADHHRDAVTGILLQKSE